MKENNYSFNFSKKKKTILVAPLHWGLGHATRCIPIIQALLNHNFNVLLGSDGAALQLLQKEFPQLPFVEFPAYSIRYPKNPLFFKLKLLLRIPTALKTIRLEKQLVDLLISQKKIDGIISDNRPGVRHKKVPSVYITHQINVLSGSTSLLTNKLHQRVIRKFDECWVPDVKNSINLSGELGHSNSFKFPVKYLGAISRMSKKNLPKKYDIACVLSGPEPQRTLLEKKLISLFANSTKEILLIRGVLKKEASTHTINSITVVDYMLGEQLENALNQSQLIISRSGYTTILDLASLEKRAFFIPTPGQFEQEYLARLIKDRGIAPSCTQKDFSLKKLKTVKLYKGFSSFKKEIDYNQLFYIFKK